MKKNQVKKIYDDVMFLKNMVAGMEFFESQVNPNSVLANIEFKELTPLKIFYGRIEPYQPRLTDLAYIYDGVAAMDTVMHYDRGTSMAFLIKMVWDAMSADRDRQELEALKAKYEKKTHRVRQSQVKSR